MIKTITVTKKATQIMYSIISPPFTEVSKQPPPFLYKIIISYLNVSCNLFQRRTDSGVTPPRLFPVFFIKASVLYRFQNVLGIDDLRAVKVGDRPRYF